MAKTNQYRLEVRFGDDLLEAGFTAAPNLFLTNYRDLGISDGAALWVVHILRFKWTEDNPYPRRSSIPMNANRDTQKRYARQLRDLGLLFTRRIYWSAKDNPPDPDLVGKIRALEYDFTSLFHNVVRISRWKAEERSLDEFQVEIPPEIMEKVASGYFHHVPKKWKRVCEEHVKAMEDQGEELGGENHSVETGEELEGENHPLEAGVLGGENRPIALEGDFKPVENHPDYKENALSNKKHQFSEEKEQEQQNTHLSVVAAVPPSELEQLILKDDEVIVDQSDDGPGFTVMPICEVVKYELGRRRSEPLYRAEIYYSVEHALGQGPDDWTEEELVRINQKMALERELDERHKRLGAFTLEEALQQYFTPQFTAQILRGKPEAELERIEDWVAYVRRQKNLNNPAGFLRTRIESGETPPLPVVSQRKPGAHLLRLSRRGDPSSGVNRPQSLDQQPQIPDLDVPGTDMTSQELWRTALGELRLQMTTATFNTWLRNTHIARVAGDHLVIATPNPYARDWLENRLGSLIRRALAGILGRSVVVEFEVVGPSDA